MGAARATPARHSERNRSTPSLPVRFLRTGRAVQRGISLGLRHSAINSESAPWFSPSYLLPNFSFSQKILSDMYNANFVKNKSAIIIITDDTTTAWVVARPTPCVPPRTVSPL